MILELYTLCRCQLRQTVNHKQLCVNYNVYWLDLRHGTLSFLNI